MIIFWHCHHHRHRHRHRCHCHCRHCHHHHHGGNGQNCSENTRLSSVQHFLVLHATWSVRLSVSRSRCWNFCHHFCITAHLYATNAVMYSCIRPCYPMSWFTPGVPIHPCWGYIWQQVIAFIFTLCVQAINKQRLDTPIWKKRKTQCTLTALRLLVFLTELATTWLIQFLAPSHSKDVMSLWLLNK